MYKIKHKHRNNVTWSFLCPGVVTTLNCVSEKTINLFEVYMFCHLQISQISYLFKRCLALGSCKYQKLSPHQVQPQLTFDKSNTYCNKATQKSHTKHCQKCCWIHGLSFEVRRSVRWVAKRFPSKWLRKFCNTLVFQFQSSHYWPRRSWPPRRLSWPLRRCWVGSIQRNWIPRYWLLWSSAGLWCPKN